MTELLFREAKREDVHQLTKLAHDLNLYHGFDIIPSEEKLFADWGRFSAFVLEMPQGGIVGFLSGYNTYQFHDAVFGFEIQNLFISQDCRHKRLGKRILHEVIHKEYECGARTFCVVVLKTNENAAAFYRSCGFIMTDAGKLYLGKLAGQNLEKFLA